MKDDKEKIKTTLKKAYYIDQDIRSKKELIEMWRLLAESCSSVGFRRLSGEKGQATTKIEYYVAKIIDTEIKLQKEIVKLIEAKIHIASLIASVDSIVLRVLLEQRYLLFKRWEDVADELGYTVNHVLKNLHPRALCAVKISKESMLVH